MLPKLKITWFKRKSITGGAAYETFLCRFLSNNFDLTQTDLETKDITSCTRNPLITKIHFMGNLWRLFIGLFFTSTDDPIVIRDFFTTAGLMFKKNRQKNIILIHHIDSSALPHSGLYKIYEKIFYKFASKADSIITVSKYWRDFFEAKGFRNVRIIYNPFDLAEFEISDSEVVEFRKKYGLSDIPLVYIGNCQAMKGVVETYNSLKELPIQMVTSGEKQVDIPVLNLFLSYREYLTLLRCCDLVVLMSKFLEGWNRTAHESMLLSRPVIGSGLGGMTELLECGGQLICRDFNSLPGEVKRVLDSEELREKMSIEGRIFAEKFTVDIFEKNWTVEINELTNCE